MAITPVRIANLTQRIPFVDSEGRLTPEALRRINEILQNLGNAVNATIEAINAAAAAQAAADAAQLAADNAQVAADQAATAGGQTAAEASIQASYIDPASVLSDGGAFINVAAHIRNYGDGTAVNVSAGTAPYAGAIGTASYVFYDQPSRAGGTVTYQSSLTAPVQTGDRHVVGGIVRGNAAGGDGPRQPGYVDPIP